jgi:hypothetical protein
VSEFFNFIGSLFTFTNDTCIKAKKKFLCFDYYGEHKYKPILVNKFMSCSNDFQVKTKCKLCGCKKENSFISYSQLLCKGIPSERLDKIKDSWNGAIWEDELDKILESKIDGGEV